MKNPGYPFGLRPLAREEGGGWLITFPDLPGCMSDGETPAEAILNGEEALASWLQTAQEFGDAIPKHGKPKAPGSCSACPKICTPALRPGPGRKG